MMELRQGCANIDHLLESAFGELEQLRDEVSRKARELDSERVRIVEERRLLHEQQVALCEEIRQLRWVLEQRVGDDPGVPDSAPQPAATASGDPVVDSVLAQFSKLQKQIAQRRESQRQR